MWCAYILRSMSHPDQEDVRAIGNRASDWRLTTRADRPRTSRHVPWELRCHFAFPDGRTPLRISSPNENENGPGAERSGPRFAKLQDA